jgi:hypothetical protein
MQAQTIEELFKVLVEKSNKFLEVNHMESRPTEENWIETLGKDKPEVQKEIVEHAQATRVILDKRVIDLAKEFIKYKQDDFLHDSNPETYNMNKDVYEGMDVYAFITRLLTQRPLTFMDAHDSWRLRDGRQGYSGFHCVGITSESTIPLKEYISYEEMAISALLGVSVPTHFINNGDRQNKGVKSESHVPKGVYTGLVGARFERRSRDSAMESRHMLIDDHCTSENGYGANPSKEVPYLKLWAKFYRVPHFPSSDEANADPERDKKYITSSRVRGMLNKDIYRERMRLSIEPFLLDANQRGMDSGKDVFCHVVGLGLGVWLITPEQSGIMVEVYGDIISRRSLPHISDIDFSYMEPSGDLRDGPKPEDKTGHKINIHFSKRNPADPIDDTKLLVAMYAWDGNAYPGNEYWVNSLTASGDPAAACCSTIPELQNPQINDKVSGENAFYFDDDGSMVPLR